MHVSRETWLKQCFQQEIHIKFKKIREKRIVIPVRYDIILL